MNKLKKYAHESLVIRSEILLPNDTNNFNNLMGGKLLNWMDIVGAISAQRHSNNVVVTASVDNVVFTKSIPLGNVITLQAKVTRAFRTSMEVHIEVFGEDIPRGEREKTNSAFFTFVAINEKGQPVQVPELIPATETEKNLYESALRRRQVRLLLADRIGIEDANELMTYFSKSKDEE